MACNIVRKTSWARFQELNVVLGCAGDSRKGPVPAIERPYAGCMTPELSRSLGNNSLHGKGCGVVEVAIVVLQKLRMETRRSAGSPQTPP